MRCLIVNADDFGLTPGVNRAIIECHTRGIVTSATLMANMLGFDDAVELAKKNPSLGVGLHFNITQGRPVAEPSRIRSLLNSHGEFLGTSTRLAQRAMIGRLGKEEVAIELRAQIERILSRGLHLTHVDSHKHAHALPQIFEVVVETINQYGIGAVRLPRDRARFNGSSLKVAKQSTLAFGLSLLCRTNTGKLRNSGVVTSDGFIGVAQTGFWTKQWLMSVIANLPEGVTELMCHPGYDDGELGNVKTRLLESRVNELQLLTDSDVARKLKEQGIRLINYSDLMQCPISLS